MKIFRGIYIGLCCAFLQLACGTPHDSELATIFDNKDTLLRAIPVSADQVSFEVCFVSKEGETIKVKENTCAPAFISEQETSIAFNEEELSQGLTEEDAKLIQEIKDAQIQTRKDNFIIGAMFVGAAATSTVLMINASTKVMYKIKRHMVKAIHSMTNISLKRLMSSNTLSLAISFSTGIILVATGASTLSFFIKTVDNNAKTLDNTENENSEKILSAASEHYYNLSAAVETLQQSTTHNPDLNLAFSTDQLLHDLGTYFKHTMPAKNIHAYCHPAASLEQRHCSTL